MAPSADDHLRHLDAIVQNRNANPNPDLNANPNINLNHNPNPNHNANANANLDPNLNLCDISELSLVPSISVSLFMKILYEPRPLD